MITKIIDDSNTDPKLPQGTSGLSRTSDYVIGPNNQHTATLNFKKGDEIIATINGNNRFFSEKMKRANALTSACSNQKLIEAFQSMDLGHELYEVFAEAVDKKLADLYSTQEDTSILAPSVSELAKSIENLKEKLGSVENTAIMQVLGMLLKNLQDPSGQVSVPVSMPSPSSAVQATKDPVPQSEQKDWSPEQLEAHRQFLVIQEKRKQALAERSNQAAESFGLISNGPRGSNGIGEF